MLWKNLIENAYKYSPKDSSIQLTTSSDALCAYINIIDCGPGIPDNQIAKIKKAFVRIPGTKPSGFGLGLSICNKVAKAHGGRLIIKNNPDVGSTFSFAFPLK